MGVQWISVIFYSSEFEWKNFTCQNHSTQAESCISAHWSFINFAKDFKTEFSTVLQKSYKKSFILVLSGKE